MTYLAAGLLVVILVQAVLRQREVAELNAIMVNQAERALQERASLLDRVQHPHLVQVPAATTDGPVPEPPADAAEMSFIGQEVPDGYMVGHDLTADEMRFIGQEVPAGVKVGEA